VEGDLQWIVLKAIEKDRDRRYETVAALAEDLRRFLSNDVISARPPTVTYRFGKFVRRNRVGVSAAVVAFLALIAGTTAASVGLVRARQAERLAASEANRANREALLGERVSEFMVGLFQLADPGEARGNTVTAREILDEGAREIRGGLADEPQVQASLMLAMGRVYLGLGLPEAATGLLQSSLAIRRRVAGDLSPDVSESLEFLADADLQSGRYDEATEGYLQALDLRRQLSGDSANSVADVLSSLSLSTWRSGDLPTALDYGEQAAAIYRANGDDPVSLADALTNTGGVLFVTGDYEGAEALVREALRLTRGVHGSEHRAVARLLNNLALLLTFQRRFDEAEPLAREALSTLRRLHGDDHYSVATSALALAMLLRELGAYAESEQLAREAVEATRRVLGAQHPNTAEALSNLAWVLLDVGDNRGAEEAAGEAATILSAVLPPDNWRVAHVNSMRGAALGRLGDVEQAEPLLLESYEHLDSAEQGRFARAALQRVIDFYVARGDAAAADRYSARMADKYGDAGGR
jgi:tetratricopeptide (TPR) repeat protein